MIGIGIRPWRLRFVCLIILLLSLILCISVSAPVKQNEQVMSYRIGKRRRITCSVSYFGAFCLSCVIRQFQIKVSNYQNASIPKTEPYCLRHYIDATTHLAPLRKAQQYCSVFNFQLVFRGLFLQFAAPCLRTQTDLVRQQAIRIIKDEKKHRSYCSVSPIWQYNAYSFCFTGAETEIDQI